MCLYMYMYCSSDGNGPLFRRSAIPGILGLGLGLGLGYYNNNTPEWRTPGMADPNRSDNMF